MNFQIAEIARWPDFLPLQKYSKQYKLIYSFISIHRISFHILYQTEKKLYPFKNYG
jgi:hypothetical protein